MLLAATVPGAICEDVIVAGAMLLAAIVAGAMSLDATVAGAIFADVTASLAILLSVIIPSDISALVKGASVGFLPTYPIMISYELISSTVDTHTSQELAVSEITFKASPD